MAATPKIRIEVAYAERERQFLVTLELPAGATVAEAIECCRAQGLLPEAAFRHPDFGVFGRKAPAERVLKWGDRVEIYRPLEVDPKEARRRRAQLKKNPFSP